MGTSVIRAWMAVLVAEFAGHCHHEGEDGGMAGGSKWDVGTVGRHWLIAAS